MSEQKENKLDEISQTEVKDNSESIEKENSNEVLQNEAKEEEKPEEQEEEKVVISPPPKDKTAVDTIDKLSKILLWVSKHPGGFARAVNEIKKNEEKIIRAFAEIIEPEIFNNVSKIVMSMFGLDIGKYNINVRPPDPEPDYESMFSSVKNILSSSDVKHPDIAFEKLKKIAMMNREDRMNYINKVIEIMINTYKREGYISAIQKFIYWATVDEGKYAYDGIVALPFFARPQYADVWTRFIASLFTALMSTFSLVRR